MGGAKIIERRIVVRLLPTMNAQMSKRRGSITSMESTSPEKRLSTRPTGVVSKKRIGCASTERSMDACKASDARVKKMAQEIPRAKTISA